MSAANPSDASSPKQPKNWWASPLFIVVLFVGVVEAGLSYSTGVTAEDLQAGLVKFMCAYLVVVTGIFFTFLWKRPWIFYPPTDFPGVSVADYVAAMRSGQSTKGTSRIAIDNLSKFFNEFLGRLDKMDLGERENIQPLMNELREGAIQSVERSILHIDPSPLLGKHASGWEEPYDAEMPVEKLLRLVWLRLQPFPPYEYGTEWILRNVTSGKVYDDIGPLRATQTSGAPDLRLLPEIQLSGGTTLEVVRPAS